ncbi:MULTISPECIES: WYL domain-containing protein [unclassified Acinetobacter]|uniref:DNA translocase FtsK n=1 Tax=unclassified Acinetobacter TaxID=196816 RepID=UPI00257922D8|nr:MULTISPECIES: WYL domain-containing protein [unclassified Acinetobacter]MDM1764224.1 WYL domain-containing protein [Acinetobacter sp. 226-1]MDM1767878.1 WYL domain-containing protein [Acinetobacter sp. 226-4]
MNAKESFVSQFFRILNVFQALPKSPNHHISIEDLLESLKTTYEPFHAPRKTLQRDLKTLNEILHRGHIDQVVASGRRSACYRLSPDAQLNLNKQNIIQDEFQSLATIHSYNFLKPYFPESWQKTLSQQFEQAQNTLELKNKNVWLTKFGFALDGAFQTHLNPKNEIKELIFKCIHQDNTWLEILYHPEALEREATRYTIKPHGVIVRGRKQYLIATKINYNRKIQIRTFTMHRILHAEPTPESLSIDIQDVDMQKAIEQYEFEGFYNDDNQPKEIQLNCSNVLLSELKFSEIHPSQQIWSDDADTYFTLTAEMPITQSFLEWLVQKAQWIEVEYPEDLREEVKNRIIEMAQNYALEVIDDDIEWQEDVEENFDEESAIQTLESILAEPEDDNVITLHDLFPQAVEFVSEKEMISTAELQRKLMISYNSAAKIIDQLLHVDFIQKSESAGKYSVLIKK